MTDYITLECPECGRQKEVSNTRGARKLFCCSDYVAIVNGVEEPNFMLKPGHTVTYKKLITHHVNPPIPIRTHDWQAYLDGEEERGHCGWGETRKDAILDLLCEIDDRMEG